MGNKMTSRERVIAALNHKTTDRIPMDFWAVPEMIEKMFKHFGINDEEALLKKLGVDIRLITPDYIGPKMEIFADGSYMEPMGTHRRDVKNDFCVYQEYVSHPFAELTTPEEVYDFPFAQVSWWNFENLAQKIKPIHEKYYVKIQTGGIFELAWALRGYEKFFMDMALEPEIIHAIMDKICTFYCEFVTKVMESAGDFIDMVYTYDDIAAQSSLLMSQAMIEEYVLPYHRRLNAVIKSFGKTVMFHSCGAVFPVIGDLIELPIDVLNPLQPKAKDMDFVKINEVFGDKVCFHGAICIQDTLPKGSPEDVRAEVRHAIDTLGKNGGYILASAHYLQADTPVENVLALYDEGEIYNRA